MELPDGFLYVVKRHVIERPVALNSDRRHRNSPSLEILDQADCFGSLGFPFDIVVIVLERQLGIGLMGEPNACST